jgi:S1-C subfamily serine protease
VELADETTLGVTPRGGVVVAEVVPQGPGDSVGLRKDDVIVALGQNRIRTLEDLSTFLEMVQAEDAVDIKVQRVVRDPHRGGRRAVELKATLMAK